MCGFLFDTRPDDEEDRFVGRECYEFNKGLDRSKDDDRCEHCRHYLTLQCKHIGEFVDEEGEA